MTDNTKEPKKEKEAPFKDGFFFTDETYKEIYSLDPDFFDDIITFPEGVNIKAGVLNRLYESNKYISNIFINPNTTIDERAFRNDDDKGNAFTLTFAPGCTKVPEAALSFSAFKTVNLPSTLKKIDKAAFSNARNLSKIDLSNVEVIEDYAFLSSGLMSINLGKNIKKLGTNIFASCKYLINAKYECDLSIPDYMFEKSSLEFFEYDKNADIVSIGTSAFDGTKLKSFEFSENIQIVNNTAFHDTKLESIVIPKTIRQIHDSAFYNCKNLKEVFFEDDIYAFPSLELGNAIFGNTAITSLTIPARTGLLHSTCSHMKELETLIVNAPLNDVPKKFALYCPKLKSVSFNTPVSTVGEAAFFDTALMDFDFSKTELIAENAFSHCNLDEIIFGDIQKISIDRNAFRGQFIHSKPEKTYIFLKNNGTVLNDLNKNFEPEDAYIVLSANNVEKHSMKIINEINKEYYKGNQILLIESDFDFLLTLSKEERRAFVDMIFNNDEEMFENAIKDELLSIRKASKLSKMVNTYLPGIGANGR